MGLGVDPFVAITALILVILVVPMDCQRPQVVNIGAVFAFDSVIGRAAKVALEAAVSDVNADTTVLKGTKLRLLMEDSGCNVFRGSFGGTVTVLLFLLCSNTCDTHPWPHQKLFIL